MVPNTFVKYYASEDHNAENSLKHLETSKRRNSPKVHHFEDPRNTLGPNPPGCAHGHWQKQECSQHTQGPNPLGRTHDYWQKRERSQIHRALISQAARPAGADNQEQLARSDQADRQEAGPLYFARVLAILACKRWRAGAPTELTAVAVSQRQPAKDTPPS